LNAHSTLFNARAKIVETVNLTSKIYDSIARAAQTTTVLSARIETGCMKRRALRIEKDLFVDANSVAKSLKKLSQTYRRLWKLRISLPYTRFYQVFKVPSLIST
jgi:hypothetical protein